MPWPCCVHKRPMRGVAGDGADDSTEVDGFLMVADGGLIPLAFGIRDDAVDTSLRIDRSDGVGDGARFASFSLPVFTWLILAQRFSYIGVFLFNYTSLNFDFFCTFGISSDFISMQKSMSSHKLHDHKKLFEGGRC